MSFFFNDTATTEIYTLSLHDALPIFHLVLLATQPAQVLGIDQRLDRGRREDRQRHLVLVVEPTDTGRGHDDDAATTPSLTNGTRDHDPRRPPARDGHARAFHPALKPG